MRGCSRVCLSKRAVTAEELVAPQFREWFLAQTPEMLIARFNLLLNTRPPLPQKITLTLNN